MEVGRIVEVAGALSDETRLRILAMLLEKPKAVTELVAGLNVSQPRASAHLAVLREAGLVLFEAEGRQRVYRVREDRVEGLLGALAALSGQVEVGPDLGARAAREALRGSPFREARTCYDHLGGLAGVRLLGGMLEEGWLEEAEEGERVSYHLTPQGGAALEERGVDVEGARRARRLFAFGCTDWTEREPHLGGALGAEILEALEGAGLVRRRAGERSVTLPEPLGGWLR